MSFQGAVEARCPKGCEPFDAQVWSFIQGDQSPELREVILARECNMLLCPGCEMVFFPTVAFVYYEPKAELLAFVFPESFREKEGFWRSKMHDDFLRFRETFGAKLSLDLAPQLFFGPEGLAELLETEDFKGEEREVMEYLARELGLGLYRISPRYAREWGIPSSLPVHPADTAVPGRAEVMEGLRRLLAANAALVEYKACYDRLHKKGGELPPPSRVPGKSP